MRREGEMGVGNAEKREERGEGRGSVRYESRGGEEKRPRDKSGPKLKGRRITNRIRRR